MSEEYTPIDSDTLSVTSTHVQFKNRGEILQELTALQHELENITNKINKLNLMISTLDAFTIKP